MRDPILRFLIGLALACFGATLLVLGALDAYAHGAARLPELMAPEKLSYFAFALVTLIPGLWFLVTGVRNGGFR